MAEIGVLDTGRSGLFGLGSGLKIEVSVYNFGTLPFSLSESNVTLTQPDGASLPLKSSNPLPGADPAGGNQNDRAEFSKAFITNRNLENIDGRI